MACPVCTAANCFGNCDNNWAGVAQTAPLAVQRAQRRVSDDPEQERAVALETVDRREPPSAAGDAVNHPPHYETGFGGVEVIQLTRHLNFCRGNAVKYLCRAGRKSGSDELEDLKKAQFYLNDEIARLEKERSSGEK